MQKDALLKKRAYRLLLAESQNTCLKDELTKVLTPVVFFSFCQVNSCYFLPLNRDRLRSLMVAASMSMNSIFDEIL